MKPGKLLLHALVILLAVITRPAGAQWTLDTGKFKIDTTKAPDDELTHKIQLLRKERGAFNIEQAAVMKIREEQSKNTSLPKEYYDRLLATFENGEANKLLENVAINFYRQCFTEAEVDDLVKFYQTSAGKKMSSDFLLIMIGSAKYAETVAEQVGKRIYNEMKVEGKIK